MKMPPKPLMQIGGILVAILVAAGWSFDYLQTGRAAAELAGHDLQDCRLAGSRIEQLRERVPQTQVGGGVEADAGRVVEDAAKTADVPPASLVRIAPQPARRIGQSQLQEQQTSLQLQQVTLRQLLGFLHAAEGAGLPARSVVISTPTENRSGDAWNAEVELFRVSVAPRASADGTVP